jgi:hypothetical protein
MFMAPFFGCPPLWAISESDSYCAKGSGKGRVGSARPAGATYDEFGDGPSLMRGERPLGMESPAPLSVSEQRAWADLVSRY